MDEQNPENIWNLLRYFLKVGKDMSGTSNLFVKSNKLNQNDRKLAQAFLECTKRDMDASKLLYRKKDYPNAIYHLQQAIEKLAKAYFMLFPSFSYSEIRQISHTTPVVFLQIVGKNWVKSLIIGLKGLLPSDGFDVLDKISDIIKTMKKTRTQVEIARLDKEQIKEFLKITDLISSTKVEQDFESILRDKGITIEEIEAFVQKEFWSKNISEQTPTGLFRKEMIREWVNYMIRTVYFFFTLYVLALITFPHERFTRYPDEEVKPTEYTKSLGIVTQFEQIIHRSEEVFKHTKSELLFDDSVHRKQARG
jgi:hypothetical protein